MTTIQSLIAGVGPEPCACGKPSRHSSGKGGVVVYRCCQCHMKNGGIPADWHPECMVIYKQRLEETR